MAPDGVEMFVGGLQDPTFGPVLFCGSGGVLVELFGDAVCRLCPVSDRDAEEMLDPVPGVQRLRGHRGRPRPTKRRCATRCCASRRSSRGYPEIQEMDINPLTVMTRGACALDVRIRIGPPQVLPSARRVRY